MAMRAARLGAVAAGILLACSRFSGSGASSSGGAPDAGGEADGSSSDAPTGLDGEAGPGVPFVVATATDPRAVAVAGDTVYFTEDAPADVRLVKVDGTPVHVIENEGAPGAIFVHGSLVYWANNNATPRVRSANLDGSGVTTVADLRSAVAIAATTDHLVIATADDHIELYRFSDYTLIGDEGGLGAPFDVTARGGEIWWTESSTHKVHHGDVNNPGLDTVSDVEDGCESIVATPTMVYWTNPAQNVVRRLVSTLVDDVAKGEIVPFSLVADGEDVYWLTTDGKLRRRRADGTLATLAAGFAPPTQDHHAKQIAITNDSVVFIGDSKILRVPK